MSQAILFDKEGVDHLDDLSERPARLGGSKLLWVDLDLGADPDPDEVGDAFGLAAKTREELANPGNAPQLRDHGRYVHVTTCAPKGDVDDGMLVVECVVGERWVVTAHDHPVPVLEDFAAQVSGSGDTGSLDGPSFLAALLEWVLGAYTAAFDRVEQQLEDFDIEAMRGGGSPGDIERLIGLRCRVGTLRRALSAHRSTLVALTHPELEALGDAASSERFRALFGRYESTLQEARDAREAIVGSFDVLIARGGQRTNEIMKVLTLVSVTLLPGTLLSGIMGMNFKVEIFERAWLFWVVIATILTVAAVTLVVARRRRWI